ncbi:MAG: hypothetical protein CVU01_01430 [Bacteroidetes bacterium HGW-Bacteroidetes-18]|nr:MAG: hypothetical protein CVU01_01430 [Bacteroidetes bacterium HGW-Bacteroidetes-18]
MNIKKSNIVFLIIISCFAIFFSSCNERLKEGTIVFTEVAGDLPDVNYITGNSWRYISESRIMALDPKKVGTSPQLLSEGFFSACAPQISYEGKQMLFAGQKKQNELWQIWEMNLENLKIRQVTSSKENCIDPAYLPDGSLAFSKFIKNDTIKTGHALFTCNRDGSEIRQITHNPHNYFASTVLRDGRILTISRQLYPDQKDGVFMVLRPDGTKQELFYRGLKGSDIHSRGQETNNGKVVFVESDESNSQGGNLISINYSRPLHSRVNLSTGIKGDFYAISTQQSGKLLVSYRSSDKEHYALYQFDAENRMLGKAIYKNKNYNVLEVVAVEKHEMPKKLPSEVDLGVKTGLLICQDINFTKKSVDSATSTSKAVKIEVMGIDASLGTVDAEEDGSFYLKILADTPFRIKTLNQSGEIVNGPGSWLYLRPNERRGCVGCHEDNEQVPENKEMLSVKKDPIKIPVRLKEIHNKKNSLK